MIEFFVDQFRIDMARSQIIAQDNILSMEPKVLQVLLILAENQGQVVLHDTILRRVWPDVLVAPNALQRCIAQLRKAFNDDAKSQHVIATHPKVGYSLVANVNWQSKLTTIEQSSSSEAEHSVIDNKPPLKIEKVMSKVLSGTLFSVLLVLMGWIFFLLAKADESLPIKQLTTLTTTDNKESQPTYSPDGRYIAFQRYIGMCKNQLWAKDTQDNKEYLLTKELGIYGTPAWSPDGTQLAFSSFTNCSQQEELKGCHEIRTLSFALAKSSPQATRKILACDQQNHEVAIWSNNEKLAYITTEQHKQRLMSLSLKDNKQTQLYHNDEHTLYSLDYSLRLNKLALTQFDLMHNFSLVLVNPDNGEYQTIKLKPPKEFKYHTRWSLSWHPSRDSLITAAGTSLFEVDLKGEFTEYTVPSMHYIYGPVFHPNGNKIVAAMGGVDVDIGELTWSEQKSLSDHRMQVEPLASANGAKLQPDYNNVINEGNSTSNTLTDHIINRSTVNEYDGQYQPHGQQLAFVSLRSGSSQIWLAPQPYNDTVPTAPARQLSQMPDNIGVYDFVWSGDGKLIILNAGRQLHLLNLNGELQPINTSFEILNIYQLASENQLLLNVVEHHQRKIILFNYESNESQTLYLGYSRLALLTSEQSLFMIDYERNFQQLIDGQLQPVNAFAQMKISNMLHDDANQLIIEDKSDNLWRYDVPTQGKSMLLRAMKNIKHVSDIDLKNKRLLFSRMASNKKEIVIFH